MPDALQNRYASSELERKSNSFVQKPRGGHAEDGSPEPGYEQSMVEGPPDRGLVGQ